MSEQKLKEQRANALVENMSPADIKRELDQISEMSDEYSVRSSRVQGNENQQRPDDSYQLEISSLGLSSAQRHEQEQSPESVTKLIPKDESSLKVQSRAEEPEISSDDSYGSQEERKVPKTSRLKQRRGVLLEPDVEPQP